MNKSFAMVTLACVLVCSVAFSSEGKETNPDAIQKDAHILAITPEEYLDLTDAQIEGIRAYWLLIDRLGYDDNGFLVLNIDEDSALTAGVSKEGYLQLKLNLQESNKGLEKAYTEMGVANVELIDLKELSRRYHSYIEGNITLEEFRSPSF